MRRYMLVELRLAGESLQALQRKYKRDILIQVQLQVQQHEEERLVLAASDDLVFCSVCPLVAYSQLQIRLSALIRSEMDNITIGGTVIKPISEATQLSFYTIEKELIQLDYSTRVHADICGFIRNLLVQTRQTLARAPSLLGYLAELKELSHSLRQTASKIPSSFSRQFGQFMKFINQKGSAFQEESCSLKKSLLQQTSKSDCISKELGELAAESLQLRQEVKGLRAQLQLRSKQLKEAKSEFRSHEGQMIEQITKICQKNKELEEQLNLLQTLKKGVRQFLLFKDCPVLQKEVPLLLAQLDNRRQRNLEVANQLGAAKQIIRLQEDSLTKLKQQSARLSREHLELAAQKGSATEQLDSAMRQLQAQCDKFKDMWAEFGKCKMRLQETEQQLRAQIGSAQAQKIQFEDELRTLGSTLDDRLYELSERNKQFSGLQEELNMQQQKVKQLQRNIFQLVRVQNLLYEKLNAAKVSEEAVRAELSQQTGLTKQLSAEVSEKNVLVAELQKSLENNLRKGRRHKSNRSLKEDVESLQCSMSESKVLSKNDLQLQREIQNSGDEAEPEVAEASPRLQQLLAQLASLEKEKQQGEARAAAREEELFISNRKLAAELKSLRQKSEEEIQRLQRLRIGISTELREANDRLSSSESKWRGLEEQLGRQKEAQSNILQTYITLRQKYTVVQAEHSKLAEDMIELDRMSSAKQAELSQRVRTLREQLRDKTQALQALDKLSAQSRQQHQTLLRKFVQKESQAEGVISALRRAEQDKRRAAISELEQQLKQSKSTLTLRLQQQRQQHCDYKQQQGLKQKELSSKLQKAEVQNARLASQVESLKFIQTLQSSTVRALEESYSQDLQKMVARLEYAQNRVQEVELQFKEQLQKLQTRIDSLLRENRELRDQIQEVRQRNSQIIAVLNSKLELRNDELSNLRRDLVRQKHNSGGRQQKKSVDDKLTQKTEQVRRLAENEIRLASSVRQLEERIEKQTEQLELLKYKIANGELRLNELSQMKKNLLNEIKAKKQEKRKKPE